MLKTGEHYRELSRKKSQAHRDRMKEKGYKTITVMLSPESQKIVADVREATGESAVFAINKIVAEYGRMITADLPVNQGSLKQPVTEKVTADQESLKQPVTKKVTADQESLKQPVTKKVTADLQESIEGNGKQVEPDLFPEPTPDPEALEQEPGQIVGIPYDEAALQGVIVQLKDEEQMGWRPIARRLEEMDYLTKRGQLKWSDKSAKAIYDRAKQN